jgi:hypothetical protein
MSRSDTLFATFLGAVVFGGAGSAAALFWSDLVGWDFSIARQLICGAAAAFVCGAALGPLLLRSVREQGSVSGILPTYCACAIWPFFLKPFGIIAGSMRLDFPILSFDMLAAIMITPFMGVLFLVPVFPFGLIGGAIFSQYVRLRDDRTQKSIAVGG